MRLYRAFRDKLRSDFFAGLFIAVPLAITIVLLAWLWEKIDKPLQGVFKIAGDGTQETPLFRLFYAIRSSQFQQVFVPLVGLAIVFFGVLALGILARSIIGRIALNGLESVVARVPIVGLLYMSMKQLGEAFVTTDGHSKFQRAVIVQFPYKGCWAIGFVTGKALNVLPVPLPENSKIDLLTVFVPTTPLPTQGFMIVVPEDETRTLDMPVQDALKLVISGGIISPGESQKHKAQVELQRRLRETKPIDKPAANASGLS